MVILGLYQTYYYINVRVMLERDSSYAFKQNELKILEKIQKKKNKRPGKFVIIDVQRGHETLQEVLVQASHMVQ